MTDMVELPPEPDGWLSENELNHIRTEMPVLYINAVPVRVNSLGEITEVGLLIRADDDMLSRALVAGRVNYHEKVRDALLRHLEKDLGAVALPRIPVSPTPFTVVEYLPTPGSSPFYDPRQHAVALAFVVPVDGDCRPQQNFLDISWISPEEAASEEVAADMVGGQDIVLRRAMSWSGAWI